MTRSLTRRITLLSIVWIVLALLCTGLLLWRLYHQHIEEHYDATVFMYLQELVAAVVHPDGQMQLSHTPSDPRFRRLNSGWYWQVLEGDAVWRRSVSLGDGVLDLGNLVLEAGRGVQPARGPSGDRVRAQVLDLYHGHRSSPVMFVVTAPESEIVDDVRHMSEHVVTGFLFLGVILSLAVVIQIKLALKPLKAIRSGISEIKSGTRSRLSQDFPSDVQPLVEELNNLLDHNEMLLKRARTQLGDLAHALKNPLAVIRNEARGIENHSGQLILEQTHLMSGNIDHHLTRARMYGQKDAIGFRTGVRSVMEDLIFAVQHIYKDRDIDVQVLCVEDKWFRGEAQDLEEMVGNLLDNACKWASHVVTLNCTMAGDRLKLVIEDDGPGIPDEHLLDVMHRGRRLDESQPGYGQGLGIVRDIATQYGGSLELARSELGGLRATLTLPSS
jgi:signal transduction histidine kinase